MNGPLDRTDLQMARVAVSYYRRAHELAKREVPPAADRCAEHLQEALSLSASGQEDAVPQQDWLSTGEVAQKLGCSERTARRTAKRIGRRIGRDWFIPADALPREEEDDSD